MSKMVCQFVEPGLDPGFRRVTWSDGQGPSRADPPRPVAVNDDASGSPGVGITLERP